MGVLGHNVYAGKIPPEWGEMTPSEAGQNAVKQSLYAALMRLKRGSGPEQKAIALYNSYGYGYALGMNFRGEHGRRDMLFWEDLLEISKQGYSALKSGVVPGNPSAGPARRRFIHGYKMNAYQGAID